MFAIETFVGRKYGMWSLGDTRFPSEQNAEAYSASVGLAEHSAKATPMIRRVVPVQS